MTLDHYNLPCEPDGVRQLPHARRSFTVVVGPGERDHLTATVFIDDAFTTSYRIQPAELPRFLHWMGDTSEQMAVPLNFAIVGKIDGQGVPLPCPPPTPPPSIERAHLVLQSSFDQLWRATGGLFPNTRDK